MTGQEHYGAAESLLQQAREATTPQETDSMLRQAQVHATLALVAATALGSMNDMRAPEFKQWETRVAASNQNL